MIWFFGKKEVEKNREEMKEEIEKMSNAEEKEEGRPGAQTPIAPPSVPVTPNKFIVRYEWKKCIGSGVCEAVAPAHFRVENGKAMLLGSKLINEENKIYEKEISDSELDANKMAADGCPPNCIRVISETGEELAPKK